MAKGNRTYIVIAGAAGDAGEGLLDEDNLVMAIERDGADGEGPVALRGETVIRAGDLLTVYSATGATEQVLDVFTK